MFGPGAELSAGRPVLVSCVVLLTRKPELSLVIRSWPSAAPRSAAPIMSASLITSSRRGFPGASAGSRRTASAGSCSCGCGADSKVGSGPRHDLAYLSIMGSDPIIDALPKIARSHGFP